MAVTDQIIRIRNAKAALKESIENKGVIVGDGTIDTYAEKVSEIEQGITPTGSLEITNNDTYDVTTYAEAIVNVPGIVPTGTINITENDTYNVSDYAEAVVNVQGSGGYQPQDNLTILQNGEYNMIHDTDKFYNPVYVEVPQPSGTATIIQNGEYDVAQYARADVQVPEIHNAFKVSTIQERDALQNVQDGDICVVQQMSIGNMTEATSNNVESILLNPTVVLPDILQSSINVNFFSNSADIIMYGDYSTMQIYIYRAETHAYNVIGYSSQDGITYTTQDILEPTMFNFDDPLSFEEYSIWDDNIGYFLQVKTVEFPGVYKASVTSNIVTWEYLDIGIDSESKDVLLNKKVYTSSGTITGTRDMKKYTEKGYIVSYTEPTDTDLYSVWVEPYDDYGISSDSAFDEYNKNYYKLYNQEIDPNIFAVEIQNRPYNFAGIYNETFYFVGEKAGDSSTRKVRKIDMSTGNVVDVATCPTLSYSASQADWDTCITVGNKIYLAPYRYNGSSYWYSSLFYVYNIDTNTFTQLASMPTNIKPYEMLYHSGMNAIIMYGFASGNAEKYFKYDIANNSWTTINTSSLSQDEQDFLNDGYSFSKSNRPLGNGYWLVGDHANVYEETASFFKYVNYSQYNSNFKTEFNGKVGSINGDNCYAIGIHKVIKFKQTGPMIFDVTNISSGNVYVDNIEEGYPISSSINANSLYSAFISQQGELVMLLWHNQHPTLTFTKINYADYMNAPISNWNSTIFTLKNLPDVLTTQGGYSYTDYLTAPGNAEIVDCYISERALRPYLYPHVRDNVVKKVWLYNRSTEQYEAIIDYSAGPDPDAPQLLSITDVVYNPLDNEDGNSIAPYMLTMNFDKAVTPQNWNMYLRANGQSQQITQYTGSGTTSFKLMFAQPNPDWISGTTVELYIESGALVDSATRNHEFAGMQTTLGIIPPTTVTVSFDSNGGSSVADRTVMYGTPCQQPTNPTRSNYTFNGWYYNGSLWDFNTPVTHSMLLTASWTYVPQPVTPSGTPYNYTAIKTFTDGTEIQLKVVYTTRMSGNDSQIKADCNIRVKPGYYYMWGINCTVQVAGVTVGSVSKTASDNGWPNDHLQWDWSFGGSWVTVSPNSSHQGTLAVSYSDGNGVSVNPSTTIDLAYLA